MPLALDCSINKLLIDSTSFCVGLYFLATATKRESSNEYTKQQSTISRMRRERERETLPWPPLGERKTPSPPTPRETINDYT